MDDFEKKLLNLLDKYHHYKYMTRKNSFWHYVGYEADMSLFDFMQWLNARK